MNSKPVQTKEPLDDGITQAQIDQLIAERKNSGATKCEVVQEGGKKVLVCDYPPL